MKKRETLYSKLNKIEKWCLYCFIIFSYLKVDSEIYNFVASNSVILHEYLL